jgi:predicted amidophosphoribosyltransferase
MDKIIEYIESLQNQCHSCGWCGAISSHCDRCVRWVPNKSHWELNRSLKHIKKMMKSFIDEIKAEGLQEAVNDGLYVHIDNVEEVYLERNS